MSDSPINLPWARYAITLGVASAVGAALYFDHVSQVDTATATFQDKERNLARNKAGEVERFFGEFYKSLRAVSLIPPMRRIEEMRNLPAGVESAVDEGIFTQEGSDVVQQFYNNLALTVPVSEVYMTMRGFDPEAGETPFFMYDALILGGAGAEGAEHDEHDFPEEAEDEEYDALVDQLAWFEKRYPTFSFSDFNEIPALITAPLRTCDNSQFYSIKNHDEWDAHGHIMSLPVYREGEGGELLGVLSGIFRTNQLEALLLDVPFLVITEADQKEATAAGFAMPDNSRFALLSPDLDLVINDRRNADLTANARGFAQGDTATSTRMSLATMPGAGTWELVYAYDMPVLEATISDLESTLWFRLGALGFLAIGLCGVFTREARAQARIAAALDDARSANDALGEANDRNRLVLDTIEQGLVMVDQDGNMQPGASAALLRWLGRYEPGTPFGDHLARLDENFGLNWSLAFDSFTDGMLPFELCKEQMPSRTRIGSAELELGCVVLGGEEDFRGLLVVIADVTDREAAAQSRKEQQETMELAQRLAKDKQGVRAYIEENGETVRSLAIGEWEDDLVTLKRALHTLKGNASLMGLKVLAEICHHVEDRVEERNAAPSNEDVDRLVERWNAIRATVRALGGEEDSGVIRISAHELAQFQARIVNSGQPDLLDTIERWALQPASTELQRQCDRAKMLANRLGKGDITAEYDDGGVLLDAESWRPFWSSLAHVIRNAVDHGLPESWDAPEGYVPTVRFTTSCSSSGFEVTVSDNGKGINWEALAASLARRGLPHETRADLEAGIFADGVSSRTEVGATSGRGVGMAAVAAIVEEHDGTISIETAQGQGTTFRFRFPLQDGVRAAA